jgi:hypothetical protein
LERYPVNALFGQLHGVKADAPDLVGSAAESRIDRHLMAESTAACVDVLAALRSERYHGCSTRSSTCQPPAPRPCRRDVPWESSLPRCAARAKRGVVNGRMAAQPEQANNKQRNESNR